MTKTDQEEFEAAMAEDEVEVLGGTPAPEPELLPAEPAPSAPPAKRRGRAAAAAKVDMPALVAAATKMIERINVRRSFGGITPTFNDRCVLCEDTGVHSAQVMRCNCPCHDLRAALDGTE